MPALAAFATFQFLWVWNDLLIALLYLAQAKAMPTVTLGGLLGSNQICGWQVVTGAAIITMAALAARCPLRLRLYFVRGLTAVKLAGGSKRQRCRRCSADRRLVEVCDFFEWKSENGGEAG